MHISRLTPFFAAVTIISKVNALHRRIGFQYYIKPRKSAFILWAHIYPFKHCGYQPIVIGLGIKAQILLNSLADFKSSLLMFFRFCFNADTFSICLFNVSASIFISSLRRWNSCLP
jgi:hypothetical protein